MPDNNVKRVKRITVAMATSKQYEWKVEKECAVIDLLTDLFHFCDAREFDFQNCIRIAKGHYSVEGGKQSIGAMEAYQAQLDHDKNLPDE